MSLYLNGLCSGRPIPGGRGHHSGYIHTHQASSGQSLIQATACPTAQPVIPQPTANNNTTEAVVVVVDDEDVIVNGVARGGEDRRALEDGDREDVGARRFR